MLAMLAMRMYPEWIHTFRETSSANEGQPEPISITLDGTKQVDGLECDVIKVVRQMRMVMGGVVMDGDDGAAGGDAGKSAVAPAVKTPETNPTVMSTETIVIARADGLPRQQTVKLVMAPPPGDAGEGMVIDGPAPGRITALDLKVNPTIADAVFTPKVPEGFTKAEPELPGFVVAGAGAPPQPQLAVKVGAAAPDFNLTNLDGNTVTLASLKGKVVLLDFWATWCGPCKAAMPTIQKLHEAYKDRGVVILGVNTWEKNADAAKDYMARKKFTYGCLLNGDDLAKAYGVTGIPTLVIIGKDGRVAMADMGLSDDTGASLRKAIDAALAK
jgi:thiol-disulfide isomerase/thioredoxin